MIGYLLKRLGETLLVLVAVSFICFAVFQYLGDPVMAVIGYEHTTPEIVQQARERLGLDRPFYVQYFVFVSRALRGDLGNSYVHIRPVIEVITERVPATLELVVVAIVLTAVFGGIMGTYTAVRPRSLLSRGVMTTSILGISTPTFLIGLLLILAFAVELHWLPSSGRGETLALGGWRTGLLTGDGLRHLILPALALSFYQFALIVRLVRAEMLEVLSKDYIRTAQSKGLARRKVVVKHGLRNAALPAITILGLQFGEMLGFSIVTETVFQWPGLGKLLISSIYTSDNPVIVVYIMFIAVVIAIANLAVDLVYSWLDPRIVYS